MAATASLPRLVLIADRFTDPAQSERAALAVGAGIRWVHLRDHAASEEAFAAAAQALVERLRAAAPDGLLSINTRLDVARKLGTGLHVGVRGPSVEAARRILGGTALIGCSVHRIKEGVEAVAAGADYLIASPIFPTGSKPGHPGIKEAGLRALCSAVPVTPVFALGGITPERVGACLEAGAYGVAVLSGIMDAALPAEAVERYCAALP